MEQIFITVEDFLATVAPRIGALAHSIETQLMRCFKDPLGPLPWTIFVGSDKKYVIKAEDIVAYFGLKAPPDPVKAADPESFRDFMETPADSPPSVPPPAPEKAQRGPRGARAAK